MIRFLILLSIVSMTLTSCDYILNIDKTGEQDTITMSLPAYSSIIIDSSCRIQLTNDANSTATLTGMDFIIDGYIFNVSNNVLTIQHKNASTLQKEKMGTITLSAQSQNTISINAPCIICSNDSISANTLNIVINGAGIYSETDALLNIKQLNLMVYGGINQSHHHLKGFAKQAIYYIEGCTDIDASELKTTSSTITHRSNADCHLNCTAQLNAIIYSTGSVYYSGSPQLSVEHRATTIMKASGNVVNDK